MIEKNLIHKLLSQNKKVLGNNVSNEFLKSIELINFRDFEQNLSIEFKSPVTAIVGKNGTGKSTLLYLVCCAFVDITSEGTTPSGRTFNEFIHESIKDKMKLGSHYGFKYGNSSSDVSFIWIERGGQRAGEKSWDRRETKEDRVQRNTVLLGYEKTISNLLNLSKYFNFKKKQINSKLFSIGTGKDKPIQLQDKTVRTINNISGKNYSSIYRRTETISKYCHGYIIDDNYSDLASGSGEISIIRMVDSIHNAPGNTLFIIDEPESGIHQIAQEKLLEFFIKESTQKNHQFIFTTHSDFILEGLNHDSIILLEVNSQNKVIARHTNRAVAFREISNRNNPKLKAIVEDNFAKKFLNQILQSDPSLESQIEVCPADRDGWEEMLRKEFPQRFIYHKSTSHDLTAKQRPIFVLDGDVREKIQLDKLNNYTNHNAVQRYINIHGLNGFIKKLSNLFSFSQNIPFKSVFKRHYNIGNSQENYSSIFSDYVDYFILNTVFLPSNVSPEQLIYEWLLKKHCSTNEINTKILSFIRPNKREDFSNLISENIPETSKKKVGKFCKVKINEIRTFNPGENVDILEMILLQWISDPSNRENIKEILETFRGMVDA